MSKAPFPLVPRASDASARIMAIDDSTDNLKLIKSMLEASGFEVLAFLDGVRALHAAERVAPDLVLLDITMPEMDGFEVCERFKAAPKLREIPIIFLTAMNDSAAKIKAFQCGGVDFISKPFHFEEVYARVATHVKIHSLQAKLGYQNRHLQALVDIKARQLSDAQLATIFAIIKLSENRDEDTGKHLERVQAYCKAIARHLMDDSVYATQFVQPDYAELIFHASPLHDVGKIAIRDSILLKPGPLDDEEMRIMRTHAEVGANTLRSIDAAHHANAFLQMGIDIAGAHHERWDGSGYPLGLAREAIPLSARIMALADVYDALRSERCYKQAIAHAAVVDMIRIQKGRHCDPVVVDAFLVLEAEFDNIRRTLV